MNFGLISNPDTNAGKVYAILNSKPGEWFDAWDLAMKAQTTCIGTVISEIRSQLDQTNGQNPAHYSPARKLHYYRILAGTVT